MHYCYIAAANSRTNKPLRTLLAADADRWAHLRVINCS